MGHATHFLERLERVEQEEMELALSLYRDVPLLRYILDEAGLPEGAERCALSLGDPVEGPFLILTREAGFVTCLGRGMRPGDLPIITRQKLDRIAGRVENLRTRLREVTAYVEGREGQMHGLYQRLFRGGAALSREDFGALRDLRLLQERRYILACTRSWADFQNLQDALMQRQERRRVARGEVNELQHRWWEALWAGVHLVAICAHLDPEVLTGGLGTGATDFYRLHAWCGLRAELNRAAFLGFWASARLGKAALPHLKAFYREVPTWHQYLTAALGLAAIAVRHSTLRAEIMKVLTRAPTTVMADFQPLIETIHPYLLRSLDFHFKLQERDIENTLAARMAHGMARDIFDLDPDREDNHEEGGIKLTPTFHIDAAQTRALGTYVKTSFTVDLEATVVFVNMLPWVVEQRAEDLFLPQRVCDHFKTYWEPEIAHMALTHHSQNNLGFQRAVPRDVKRIGKDDPCPCGSGKRFRRCCQKR